MLLVSRSRKNATILDFHSFLLLTWSHQYFPSGFRHSRTRSTRRWRLDSSIRKCQNCTSEALQCQQSSFSNCNLMGESVVCRKYCSHCCDWLSWTLSADGPLGWVSMKPWVTCPEILKREVFGASYGIPGRYHDGLDVGYWHWRIREGMLLCCSKLEPNFTFWFGGNRHGGKSTWFSCATWTSWWAAWQDCGGRLGCPIERTCKLDIIWRTKLGRSLKWSIPCKRRHGTGTSCNLISCIVWSSTRR